MSGTDDSVGEPDDACSVTFRTGSASGMDICEGRDGCGGYVHDTSAHRAFHQRTAVPFQRSGTVHVNRGVRPVAAWQVKTVAMPSGADDSPRRRTEQDALDVLLSEGWEPFAATQADSRMRVLYHLRRQVENVSGEDGL